MTTTPAEARPSRTGMDPEVTRTAWTVLVGGLAVLFDTTIVAVAIRTLATDLHVGLTTIQWVSTAYLLALGVAVPLVGWAQRVLGAKRLWMTALAIFLLGSVLCSLAWSAASLIAFRVVQGLGGGILMPLMMTIIMQAARGQNLGRMAVIIGLPVALGPIIGPVIGGLILQNLHWSWLFWVNVPFCVAGLVLARRFLAPDGPVQRVRLDVVGLALLAPGLVGVLYGLSNVSRDGGFTRTDVWAPAAAGLVLVAAFCLWAVPRGRAALVNVRLLAHRPLATSSVLMGLSGFGLFGAMFLLPLYFQGVRGHDVLGAGLLLVPQGVGALASRVALGRVIDKVGPRWITLTSFAMVALATVPFALAGAATSQAWLMVVLFFRGLGLGSAIIPLMAHAFAGLAHDDVPDASIVSRLIQQLGGSFGTAVLATVLASATAGAGTVADMADGFDQAFWVAVAFTMLAVALSFLLPAEPPGRQQTAAQGARAPEGAAANG
ncbi:DHA2 family efflux MFS transporter permease subunit [Xylanimonas allomyrinae]|uniref:DHA2 family efflux MFS transporter permease subunit n=1 Tax=Xylanimonas allomyrinae TaxID=2509459 RepID=A0A4P6EJP9_9MICO|nr:MDR family MFS transporter [Xylanimonas allomyrinae]QAY62764.1 DHA2 family efflux MFS transporter permease subunit [Xylanimonas allomyrinae]